MSGRSARFVDGSNHLFCVLKPREVVVVPAVAQLGCFEKVLAADFFIAGIFECIHEASCLVRKIRLLFHGAKELRFRGSFESDGSIAIDERAVQRQPGIHIAR